MRVLHYYLGPSPIRSGGLTKYVEDLMMAQRNSGQECFELYPIGLSLRREMYVKASRTRENSFQLINAYPLPLSGGIAESEPFFIQHVDLDSFRKMLQTIDVDIVHIHTLMGLPKEFLKMTHEMGIRTIFTTHDYFGLSPVPDFYNETTHKSFAFDSTSQQVQAWQEIAANSKTPVKLKVFQLKQYATIKRILRFVLKAKPESESIQVKSSSENFRPLMVYYKSMLKLIDAFHFNSQVSRKVYLANLPELGMKKNLVIPITNNSIRENIVKKAVPSVKSSSIKVGYIGRFTQAKGVYDLIEMFGNLVNQQPRLYLYGDKLNHVIKQKNVHNQGAYKYTELNQVMAGLDVVVIPSVWEETFGMVVLECVTHGVPVIFSNHVGAGMLFDKDYPGRYDSWQDLKNILENLSQDYLTELNVATNITVPSMLDVEQVYQL